MRTVAFTLAMLLVPCCATMARAETSRPLDRQLPPAGLFFDDPVAIAPDGKAVAMLSTDAASVSQLELWFPAASGQEARAARAPETPHDIDAIYFLGPNRLLLVSRQPAGDRHTARIADITRDGSSARITVGRRVLGPADAIMAIERDGKPTISLYSHARKRGGAEHSVQLLAADGQTSLGRHSLSEDAEGQLTSRAGAVRPLWWSNGHTELNAQKLGAYDKAHDFQRPHSFVRIDALADKLLLEQPIDDVLGFARASLAHKAVPDAEAFVSFSEDQRELVLHDGLKERVISLSRPIDVYDKASLRTVRLDGQHLIIGLQVDPNNTAALERKQPDTDEIDLYVVDRSATDAIAKRVLVLPGAGRPASFLAATKRLLLLRKGKGFERGSVSAELYALP